jgi:hypothetical protein
MKKNILLIVLWITVLLTSCLNPNVYHMYYSPNVQNVPLFTKKNEFTGHVVGSFGAVDNSFEIQAGRSLPGHVALTVNYMIGGEDNLSGSTDHSKIHYFEGTVGFYTSFKAIGVFEIYSGYGKGSQHHVFSYIDTSWPFPLWVIPDGTADLSFSKLFIQPDIGIKTKWMEGAFSCRLSKLNFNDIKINNTVRHLDELNTLKQNEAPWLLEPAFTLRGGFKAVKIQIQFIYAGNLTNPDLLFDKFRFNIGLYFNLSNKQSEN